MRWVTLAMTVLFFSFVEGYRGISFPGASESEHTNYPSKTKHLNLSVYLQAAMLKVLMDNNLDQRNIVKFYGGFWMNECLEFEMLDISLSRYLYRRRAPMRLQDIRTVIQQVWHQFEGRSDCIVSFIM